jgi:hypothetical protein
MPALQELYIFGLSHILHQRQKPGFLQILKPKTLNLWLRNRVFCPKGQAPPMVLLRMVPNMSYAI